MQVERVKIHSALRPTDDEKHAPSDWLTGILYLEVGDIFFPAQGGGDYVLVNLASWIDNAHRLVFPAFEVTNGFRENSCSFVLSRVPGSENILMKLFDARGALLSEHFVSLRRYLAALRGAAKALLHEIDAHGLNDKPYRYDMHDRLAHIERLEEHIKTHGLP